MASWGEWCWDGIRFCDPVDGSTAILNASYSNTSNTTLCWDRLVDDTLSTWRQGLVIQVSLQILQILFPAMPLDGLNIFFGTMNENEMSSRIRLDVLFSAGVGRSKSFWLSPGSLHQLRSTALREVAVLKDRQFQMPRETRIISSGFGCWQMNRDIFWHIATSRVATAYNTDYQYQCRSRQPTCFSKLAVTSIAWV